MVPLVVGREPEERRLLDVGEDRLDVVEELAVPVGQVVVSFLRSLPVSGFFETSGAPAPRAAPAGRRRAGRRGRRAREAAGGVALAPRDVLDRRRDEERRGAGSRIGLERRRPAFADGGRRTDSPSRTVQ